jgi:ankyrin repeat protein
LHFTFSPAEAHLVDFLCNAGADWTILDQDDDTALHIATAFSGVDSVELLLQHGSKVDAQNKRGCTALHEAVRRCRTDIIEAL